MNVHLKFLFAFSIFFNLHVFSQSKTDLIPENNINAPYLEHLIKLKVDSVRQVHNCSHLINDSILFIASKHHSQYMNTNGVLSHKEKDKSYENPSLRVIEYGGKGYKTGENVLFTFYNRPIKVNKKSKKTTILKTYEQLAHHMVNSWVNSPGHFKNIINCKYKLTGVSIAIDYKKKKVYATQKFAWKINAFNTPKHPKLFPYDTYQPKSKITSFSNIPQLQQQHDHLWELKHDTDSIECSPCDSILNHTPGIRMQFKNKRFKLRIENSEFVKEIIQNKYDGFAIEIIEIKDYLCGNSAYYTKPSRRNKQCVLNGQPLEPVYRKEIYKGFKNRKRIKDFKFIPYMFKDSSIPFLHKFKRFNIDKYSSKYFELDLGEIPELESSIWAYNLLVIKNKRICKSYAFQSICGELFEEKFPLDYIPPDSSGEYSFPPLFEVYTKQISFKPQEERVNSQIFNDFVNNKRNKDYELDSLIIACYASIEGDSLKNLKLQKKRAINIQKVLDKNNLKGNTNITFTRTNWKHFNKTIKKSECWKFLNLLDHKTKIKFINNDYKEELQPILKSGRTAHVRFVEKIPFNDKHLLLYIQTENRSLIDSIYKYQNDTEKRIGFNKELHKLYCYVHKLVVKGKLKPHVLVHFILPQINLLERETKEHRVLYAYEYPKAFGLDKSKREQEVWINHIDDVHKGETSSLYTYQKYYEEVNAIIQGKSRCDFKYAQNLIFNLESFYTNLKTPKNTFQISSMVANINYYLLNHVFNDKPKGNMINAMQALNQLQNFYETQINYTVENALALAKMAQYYRLESYVTSFLESHAHLPEVQAYIIMLEYQTYDLNGSFYQNLTKAADVFPRDIWCSMFLNSCTIPFQVFNNEKVRDLYCEKCSEELNNHLESSISNQ